MGGRVCVTAEAGDNGGVTRTRTLLAVVLVACLAVIVVGALATDRDDSVGVSVGRAMVRSDEAPAVGLVRETTTTLATLPIPDALPVDAYAPTPEVSIGTIEIPKLGLTDEIGTGITLTSIDRGPAWWPGTARPGQLGNVVLAGHRTTHSQPFNQLDTLVEGDQVVFTTEAGRFVYAVRGVIVVPADWIDIAAQDRAHTATLFACHPKGSATHRVVAKLRLLGPDGTPADPDEALPPLDAEEHRTEHTLVMRTVDGAGSTSEASTSEASRVGDPLVGAEG